MEIKPILRTELRERNLGKCVGKSVQWLRDHIEIQKKTVDALNFLDIFGYPGGVSFMSENGDGKRFMNRMSDLSYIN